jgi:hypothetical protein
MGAAVRAFSQPQFPDALEEIAIQAVRQLRNLLHQGKLHGYYFGHWGRQSVSCEFWATADANGILERAVYWPLGRPSSLYEQRPNCPLFVLRSELDALLSAEPAKKRSLPRSKIPELVAALRELGDLQNRQLQYAALCELPQFREFKITAPISGKRQDICRARAGGNRAKNSAANYYAKFRSARLARFKNSSAAHMNVLRPFIAEA